MRFKILFTLCVMLAVAWGAAMVWHSNNPDWNRPAFGAEAPKQTVTEIKLTEIGSIKVSGNESGVDCLLLVKSAAPNKYYGVTLHRNNAEDLQIVPDLKENEVPWVMISHPYAVQSWAESRTWQSGGGNIIIHVHSLNQIK